jgi:hypothetical protein
MAVVLAVTQAWVVRVVVRAGKMRVLADREHRTGWQGKAALVVPPRMRLHRRQVLMSTFMMPMQQ